MQRFTVRNIILRHSFSTTQRKRVTIEHIEVSMRPVPSCTVAPENLSFVLYCTEEVLLTEEVSVWEQNLNFLQYEWAAVPYCLHSSVREPEGLGDVLIARPVYILPRATHVRR